jgi:dihydropyrimidinase
MRSAETVAALRDRLRRGDIDTVSSDHSCYDLSQKREHADDVRAMPHGLPGVETRMATTFTALLAGPDDDALASPGLLERFVDVFATAPARINALPRKGILAPGYDADVVVFDPAEVRTVVGAGLHMGTDFSPFDGFALRGWPQVVVSGGRVVLDAAGFHDPGPVGRRLRQGGYRDSAGHLGASPGALVE